MKKKIKAKKDGFFRDFKKFITKGNIIDMAVGVVIGSAFSAIVNGLVKMIINPVIALLTGGVSLDGWKTVLVKEVLDEAGEVATAEVAILWGEWIQTIINFFIIAISIFVAVRIITGINNRLRAKELAAIAEADAKKKAEEKAKADALAAEQKAKEEALAKFYANVELQTKLLEEIAKK
ncbi:MAG: large conductance mechanosensitive channel protein MscL [Clostridia bacterium]|nr:large conductance mechanosensitive channel protein MscL [Clostridia bacterium]MBR7111695.1 large conductance mechanosensitive channel protein MscL [Clostridia bacterium]